MNVGKKFEKDIKDSVPNDIFYLRLTDPAIGFNASSNEESASSEPSRGESPGDNGTKNNKPRFAPKNPFDIVLYKRPEMFCIELKSKQAKSISFAGSSPDIRSHQIKALTEAAKYCNAGLILNFRDTNNTYYVPIQSFNKLTESIDKKSVNEKDISPIGLVIPNRKLKVNYRYNLNVIFENHNYNNIFI